MSAIASDDVEVSELRENRRRIIIIIIIIIMPTLVHINVLYIPLLVFMYSVRSH